MNMWSPALVLLLQFVTALPASNSSSLAGSEGSLQPQNISINIRKTVETAACQRPSHSLRNKKGVAFSAANTQFANLFRSPSWAYNWASDEHFYNPRSPALNNHYEFVPMMWGRKPDQVRDWKSQAEKMLKYGSRDLLAFNEPDRPDQSNMRVVDAVGAYKNFMHQFSCQARLGAPAVSSDQAKGRGLDWLSQFLAACPDCIIDFVPIHIYVSSSTRDPLEWFKGQVRRAEEVTKKNGRTHKQLPIWITEFQFTNFDKKREEQLLRDAVKWLNSEPGVERYAYFLADRNHLVNAAGNGLSDLGRVYDSI